MTTDPLESYMLELNPELELELRTVHKPWLFWSEGAIRGDPRVLGEPQANSMPNECTRGAAETTEVRSFHSSERRDGSTAAPFCRLSPDTSKWNRLSFKSEHPEEPAQNAEQHFAEKAKAAFATQQRPQSEDRFPACLVSAPWVGESGADGPWHAD